MRLQAEGEKMKIILASRSPRRVQLLAQIGIEASVQPSMLPEVVSSSSPREVVRILSQQKASDIAGRQEEPAVVIGADTVVAVDGQILGKPKSHEAAYAMIRKIQGRTHEVYTGVTVICGQKTVSFVECTQVEVAPMTVEEMQAYADSAEPMDKAGGYGIQGLFGRYVTRIVGDYNNIVGLPVAHLYQVLKELEAV